MIKIIFCGVDDFNRATFVNIEKKNKFYCDTDNLFPYGATEDEVLKFYEENKNQTNCIVYKGNTFNSEPSGEDVDIELCKIEDMKQKKQLDKKMMEKKKEEEETQKTIVEMAKVILEKMGIVENQLCIVPDGSKQFITPYWYNLYLDLTIKEIKGFTDIIRGKRKEGK